MTSDGPEKDEALQEFSRRWWTRNPMSYDWGKTMSAEEGTREFYEEIDRRLFDASPFYAGTRPFEKLIPFDSLRGKRVLDIGCGMGSHAQLLAEAGCVVTAIDLTPRAVELTKQRLSLNRVTADVQAMDAEHMEFADETFDFVWSWGVIHHSASPQRILQEAYRVLRRTGELRLMVYHRRSLSAFTTLARGLFSGKWFKGMSFSDMLSFYSDGYIARFYTRADLSDILHMCGFSSVSTYVLGQKADLIPLPTSKLTVPLKSALVSKFPNPVAERLLSSVGGFLFSVAIKAGAESSMSWQRSPSNPDELSSPC